MSDIDDFEGRLRNENIKPVEKYLGFDQPKPGLGEETLSMGMLPNSDATQRWLEHQKEGYQSPIHGVHRRSPEPWHWEFNPPLRGHGIVQYVPKSMLDHRTMLTRWFFLGKLGSLAISIMDAESLRAITLKLADAYCSIDGANEALGLTDIDTMTLDELRQTLTSFLPVVEAFRLAGNPDGSD